MSTDCEKSDPFERKLSQSLPKGIWTDHRACVAVSGGADSVSLLHALVRIAKRHDAVSRILVAHVDHRTRNGESHADANFVEALANKLKVSCAVGQMEPDRLRQESARLGSWEAAARNLRYEMLIHFAQNHGARYLLVAHNADDRTETALQRIFRGTGFAGLKAIPRSRPLNQAVVLIRPLLDSRRMEIEEYLNRIGAEWRNDSSNASPDYTRNRIRNRLIPVLEEIFPNRWRDAVDRLMDSADEIDSFLAAEVERLITNIRVDTKSSQEVSLEIDAFDGVPKLVIGEYFRRLWRDQSWPLGEMGRKQWRRLELLVLHRTGTEEFPGGVQVTIGHGRMILRLR